MEITLLKRSEKTRLATYTTTTLNEVIEAIKACRYKAFVEPLRQWMAEMPTEQDSTWHGRLPRVIPAGKCLKRGGSAPQWFTYTGIVALKVGGIDHKFRQERVKEGAMLLPQTMAAFLDGSGRSVIILTRAELPGGKLPKDERDIELFHIKAYRTAVMCYAPVFDCPILTEEPRLDASFLMSCDADLRQNAHAVPFVIPQPSEQEVDRLLDGRLPKNQLLQDQPVSEPQFLSMHQVFNNCVMQASQTMSAEQWQVPYAAITCIARGCAECGMPEEEATQHLLWRYYKEDCQDVRSTVRSVYAEAAPLPPLSPNMPKKQVASIRLKEFIGRRYELRRNTVTRMMEYRTKYSLDFRFRELTKVDRNTIKYEAAMEGIEAFDAEINGFIDSNYTPDYNPIEDYIDNLGTWDGKDRIAQLCRMVPTDNPHWETLFRRWFLSMVAHWMHVDTEHGNNTAPILIGAQGYRKSTFCRILLPPELRSFFTDSVDFRTKQEAERYLTRFLLINIDEFDQLSEAQFAFVKHLFQKPVVSMRRMYSEAIGQQRRYASFIGTSNHQEILRDPTGNRRYLCVEVKAPIRTDVPIEYAQLYAQAVTLIQKGERYWLNDADEALLNEANAGFEVRTPLEQVLLDVIAPAKENEEGARLLKSTEIMGLVSGHKAFNRKKMADLSLLGRVLRKLNFATKRKTDGTYYFASLRVKSEE